MYPQLSVEQAPALKVPVRFFLSMPLFGMLSAALLFFSPDAFSNRWLPQTLALTHLFTLGVLTMSMFGALFQMLPVVAGAPIAHANAVSLWVHALLCTGILSLAGGLLSGQPLLLTPAMVLLSGAIMIFIGAAAGSLVRVPRLTRSVIGMRLAIAALALTLALGLMLLAGHALPQFPLLRVRLTSLHIGWGLVGWVGLLVMSVAYQVVPMFQMTPDYSNRVKKLLVPATFSTLLIWSLLKVTRDAGLLNTQTVVDIPAALTVAGLSFFAVYTLRLQARRRRRIADVTLDFWRVGMVMLLAGALLWTAGRFMPLHTTLQHSVYLMAAVLLTVGFGLSVINGMLYKILPFLVWLHLQRHLSGAGERLSLPKMRHIITGDKMKRQFSVHLLGCILLAAATVSPGFLLRPAAVALFVSFLLLGINLFSAWRYYLRQLTRISIYREHRQ